MSWLFIGLLACAVAVLRASGIEANGEVGSGVGSTSRELLDIASRFGATVIVIGDRGSHLSDLLLGSVAARVVRYAHCPVFLAVPPGIPAEAAKE